MSIQFGPVYVPPEQYQAFNISTTPAPSTTTQSNANITTTKSPSVDASEKVWLGMDSTQILILFLVVVFAIIILFLLIYYCVIKGMRRRSISRDPSAIKSTSGSMNDDKARNIFSHPERQLAVDQSTRNSPSHSPSSSTADQQRSDQAKQPVATTVTITQQQQTQPQAAPQQSHQPQQQQQQQQVVPPIKSLQQQQQLIVSNAPGPRKSKRKDREPETSEGRHTHGLIGSLAGLRDTLTGADR